MTLVACEMYFNKPQRAAGSGQQAAGTIPNMDLFGKCCDEHEQQHPLRQQRQSLVALEFVGLEVLIQLNGGKAKQEGRHLSSRLVLDAHNAAREREPPDSFYNFEPEAPEVGWSGG